MRQDLKVNTLWCLHMDATVTPQRHDTLAGMAEHIHVICALNITSYMHINFQDIFTHIYFYSG